MININELLSYVTLRVAHAGTATDLPDTGGTSTVFGSLSAFVTFIINLVFGVGISISLVFLIVCGIKYAMSSGDQSKAEEARNCITNAIIGAVVIIAFRLLINLALNLFGFKGVDELLPTS